MKILVVDDEKSIRDLFKKVLYLALPDCRVDLAVNGAEAVDSYREGRHDILVMDLYMPIKDGFEAFLDIQALCKEEGVEMPCVLFCTAYIIPDQLQKIVDASPRHFILQKPINTQILLRELRARMPAKKL